MADRCGCSLRDRLGHIDLRLSKVDRRLGYLRSRLYFTPTGGTQAEAPITKVIDQGETSVRRSGLDIEAHRVRIMVDRCWSEQNRGLKGVWELRQDEGLSLTRLELENQVIDEAKTQGVFTFRVAKDIETYSAATA